MLKINLKIQMKKKQQLEIVQKRADHDMVKMSNSKQNYKFNEIDRNFFLQGVTTEAKEGDLLGFQVKFPEMSDIFEIVKSIQKGNKIKE